MTEPTAPAPARPPAGLRKAGRQLWRSFAEYELDPRESVILTMAAKLADTVADLESLVDAGTLITKGSAGQDIVNPAVIEARLGRAAIDKLLARLDLPVAEDGFMTTSQLRAQHAARARWAMQRARRAGGAEHGPA